MHIGTCVVTLQLYGVDSLKEKRRILKPITTRLPKEFNISTAELEHNDVWRTAVIGLAAVGNDAAHIHARLEKAVAWIEQQRLDLSIEGYTIEFR
jgi:uncharacterized protein YlxP (DUF503 family)